MSISLMIQINNVEKNYKNIMLTYKEITIDSRVTLLLGENGCGKSTLLKAMLNLIQYRGNIIIHGTCSYMPESPSFPIDITVDEFLKALYPKTDPTPLLAMFQLSQKRYSIISTLSKGMKGKLNVIQCLMEEADWYLLDEPLNGLDYEGLATLIRYIASSPKRFIISTHIVDAFQQLKTDVIRLD